MLKYKISKFGYQWAVTRVDGKGLVFWDDAAPLHVLASTYAHAIKCVKAMEENQSKHESAWDAYGERMMGC